MLSFAYVWHAGFRSFRVHSAAWVVNYLWFELVERCFTPLILREPWLCCIHMCYNTYGYTDACRIITTTQSRRWATQFLEKYTSHFIWKGCVWEGVGDRTELQHIDTHLYGPQRFFPVLQGCSTRRPGAQLSAECCFLYSIFSNSLISKLIEFPVYWVI